MRNNPEIGDTYYILEYKVQRSIHERPEIIVDENGDEWVKRLKPVFAYEISEIEIVGKIEIVISGRVEHDCDRETTYHFVNRTTGDLDYFSQSEFTDPESSILSSIIEARKKLAEKNA